MFNFLPSPKETNLTTAWRFLFAEMVVGVTLTFTLSQLELPGQDLVFVGVWLFNLIVAYYLAKAARAQGKSAWLYGLFSALVPAYALLAFFSLRRNEIYAEWDAC